MSETPRPLWELVRYFNESTVGIGNYGQMRPLSEVERDVARACATELATALRAWDEQLNDEWPAAIARTIRVQILGVPPKEPAQKDREVTG